MPNNTIQYVIKWGGFEDGYELVGSFDSFVKASEYATENMKYFIWEIVMLQKPIKVTPCTGVCKHDL